MKIKNAVIIITLSCFTFLGQAFALEYGTVKYYSDARGYGFITPDSGGSSVILEKSQIKMLIRVGDKISYNTIPDKKGRMIAIDIKVIG